MLVVMQAQATEEQVRAVCQKIEALGYRAHSMPGAQRTAIGITGNKGEVESGSLEEMPECRKSSASEALQASQPRHQARQHRHQFPIQRPSVAPISPYRRTLRHRDPRPGLRYRRARCSRRSPVLPRRRLQTPHLSLFFPGPGRRSPEDMAEIRDRFGCSSSPKPSITNRSTWSTSTPTSSRSAPATCKTSLCSSAPDAPASPSC